MTDSKFNLRYIGQEQHLMMPRLTTITTTQALYDILFQYVMTPEKEEKLISFIDRIRRHFDANTYRNTPFSLPEDELAFLEDEGLEELKLMCWQPIPVHVFDLEINAAEGSLQFQEYVDLAENLLAELFVFNWRGPSQIIVFPPEAL
ncbi:MAG: hypothetical protein ACM3PP_04240 [Candidatus Saccharibacteria bacterium]